MTQAPPKGFSLSHCAADVSFGPQTLTVTLTGNFDMTAADQLRTLLTRVHAEALRLKVTEVAVDFRGLEFMTSACFKGFVVWLNELDAMEEARQYRVRLRSNPAKYWQRASLLALSSLAIGLVHVEM